MSVCRASMVLFFALAMSGGVASSSFAAEPGGGGRPPMTVAALAGIQNAIDRAIARLDSDTWDEREAAEKELSTELIRNPVALNYVFLVRKNAADPEVRYRLTNVLRSFYRERVNPVAGKRGFIGLALSPIQYGNPPDFPASILITEVEAGMPGQKAGLKMGDMILETDGRNMSTDGFIAYIAARGPGRVVDMKVRRGNTVMEVKVVLTERPKHLADPLKGKSPEDFFREWIRKYGKSKVGN